MINFPCKSSRIDVNGKSPLGRLEQVKIFIGPKTVLIKTPHFNVAEAGINSLYLLVRFILKNNVSYIVAPPCGIKGIGDDHLCL
jgi:hypothetical protein